MYLLQRKKKIRTGPGDDEYFVVTMEAPLHYSQVQLADPETGRPTRVIFMFTPDGKRVRARKVPNPTVNDIIPTPPEDPDPRAGLVGAKDTPAELARQGTYLPSAGFPFRVRNLERIWAGLHPDAPASPPATEDGEKTGRVDRVGGGGSHVLFPPASPSSQSPLSAGGLRGLCTATASSSELAATVRCAGGKGRLGGRMVQDDGPPHMLPLAASFALTGLRQQLSGGGSRQEWSGDMGQGLLPSPSQLLLRSRGLASGAKKLAA
ncbi:hypothetical protein Vretimale_10377 [Volvox reticuliferus]|uniref:Large ribosomal subunit protein uL24 C-terminal domain-containing protein n=1 Tax=Volvox reticuliferus TaxID=1737510 RepID=A0A8J4LPQ8_9CHLO|nr:hypothetical protein Vretifemale_12358 [Volvox reticuliferus]GIM05969.1 hypothetical protein Vretimale_10377 [Volvox reticuliferus]